MRHAERCLGLLILLDMSLPEPWESLCILRNEVLCFSTHLSQRPQIIVANKMDCEGSEVGNFMGFAISAPCTVLHSQSYFALLQENAEELMKRCKGDRIIAISAKHGQNLNILLGEMRKIYDQQREKRHKRISSDRNEANDYLA